MKKFFLGNHYKVYGVFRIRFKTRNTKTRPLQVDFFSCSFDDTDTDVDEIISVHYHSIKRLL